MILSLMGKESNAGRMVFSYQPTKIMCRCVYVVMIQFDLQGSISVNNIISKNKYSKLELNKILHGSGILQSAVKINSLM